MPTSVPRKRSRIAVLAVLAMIASALFAISASPALGVSGSADFAAVFEACPEGSAPDAGFTDVADTSFAADAVDCLAYYNVTQGTSATTYSPGDVVTRWQMALFLIRAAGPAGIAVPAATDQGFTDISGLPQGTQDAINQLAALGITTGATATEYQPYEPVYRWQMALFLARLLNIATIGPGGGPRPVVLLSDDAQFTDIAGVWAEAQVAIYDIFELGITTGATATTFNPFGSVTREQMAAFINRTLNHTNARPIGITIQAVPESLTNPGPVWIAVSMRDGSFAPVSAARVDVFNAPLADQADALLADGQCDFTVIDDEAAFSTIPVLGHTPCTIDGRDLSTNVAGNIFPLAAPGPSTINPLGASTIWWAWSGSSGAVFDVDTTPVASDSVTVAQPGLAIDAIEITPSTPRGGNWAALGTPAGPVFGSLNRFGSVTWTMQLVDTNNVAVPRAGITINISYERWVNGVYDSDYTVQAVTDANGTATFTFTEADTQPFPFSNSATYDVYWWGASGPGLKAGWANGIGGDIMPTGAYAAVWDEDIVFDDDLSFNFNIVPDANTYTAGGANLMAGATVVDQYGAPRAGQTLLAATFDIPAFPVMLGGLCGGDDCKLPVLDPLANVSPPFNAPSVLVTDAAGHVSINLALPGGINGIFPIGRNGVFNIKFWEDTIPNGTPQPAELQDDQAGWYAVVNPANALYDGTVQTVYVAHVDKANDRMVVYFEPAAAWTGAGNYWVFEYDSGDVFLLGGAPVTMAVFEAALSRADVMVIDYVAGNPDVFRIAVNN
jgi:hypothetical protein